jgi:3-methyladenine DNA glycosylase AlkD
MIHTYNLVLQSHFQKAKNPTNAVAMEKYMKNKFTFFGIKTPERKLIYKDFLLQMGYPKVEELENIVLELWQQPEREYQYFAMELVEKFSKKPTENYILLLEKLIVQKSWWDTVDLLASHSVANYFRFYPQTIPEITEKWIESENIWLQRTCLLFQLFYRKQTNTILLLDYIRMLADSKEFFIQKAIGWALRQYARTDANTVKQFVEKTPLKPLSRREALKHIGE